MPTRTLVAQTVNGDPFTGGGNINITTNSNVTLDFDEIDKLLGDPQPGESVSYNGNSGLTYTFLGFGDVRGDPLQRAAFVRIENPNGTFTTVAIDMNADGDGTPNLQSGNTKLRTSDLTNTGPESYPGPVCFTPGTLIETARGPRPIETLSVGDRIRTRDHGLQVLRWIGCQTRSAWGASAPVVFAPGTLGNREELVVSQQHRMLISGWRAQLFAGADEVLVAAKYLVDGRDITLRRGGTVTYIHLMFDRHEILRGGGIWSESYFPGNAADLPEAELRAELLSLFPELGKPGFAQKAARRVVKQYEATCLVA